MRSVPGFNPAIAWLLALLMGGVAAPSVQAVTSVESVPAAKAVGAHIGISKRFIYAGLSGGLPLVKIRFTVTNYGDVTISNIAISEDLNGVYGSGNFTHITDPNQVNGEGSLNYNAAFDGNTDTALISAGSSLAPSETVTFEIVSRINTITDQGFGTGVYHNQVTVTGTDPDTNPVNDLSQDGSDPDPDGNDDPSDNSEVSIIDLNESPAIGIAHQVTVNGAQLTFDYYLENLGDVSLSSVSFDSELAQILGDGNYTIDAISLPDDPGSLTLNAGFDGDNDISVFDPASSSLAAGDTAQYRIVLTVAGLVDAQGLGAGSHSSQAIVSATSGLGVNVSDSSDDGSDPDPDADNNANEAGENDATAFVLVADGVAGAALDATVSSNEVTFTHTLAHLAGAAVSQLSLTQSLDDVFGAGNYTITAGPTVTSGSLDLNPSFNGADDSELLQTTSSLAIAGLATIELTVRVDTETNQGAGAGVYDSQATLGYVDGNGFAVEDLSDAGLDPDTDDDGVANETGENDATSFTVAGSPAIGVAQQGFVSGTLITLQIAIENLGDSTLSSITLSSDLDAVFGAGNYAISSTPARVSGASTLNLNGGFTGSGGSTAVVTGGSLAPGAIEVVSLAVNVTNVTDQGFGLGVYSSSVTASGNAPDSSVVSDVSDSGSDPDPNGNGNAADAGESDATSLIIGDEVIPGVAMTAAVSGTVVTFDIFLENLGGSTLSSLALDLDLDAVFGAGNYTVFQAPSLTTDPGTLTLNGSYDGSADTAILVSGSSGLDTTTPDAQIHLGVNITNVVDQGSGLGSYSVQSRLTGTGPLGSTSSDLSDANNDPDPSGNGIPRDADEDDPTTFTVSVVRVGLAKSASVSGDEVSFTLVVENVGSATPTSVSISDDLDAVFGAGKYTVVSAPALTSAPRDLEPDVGYSGAAGDAVLATGTVAAGISETLEWTVRVDHISDRGSGLGVYSNQASVTADSQTDSSDSGSNPDPDGDGQPDEAGENDATSFTVTAQAPVIGLALTASPSGDLVSFDYYLENLGNVDLSSLALSNDLDAVFGAGNYVINTAPVLVDDPGTLTLNSSFDGSSQTGLISSGTLGYGDTARIRVEVEVTVPSDQGSGYGVYSNQASVSASAPNSTTTSDSSDSGSNPDPDGDGIADEAGENDATTFSQSLSRLGVAKAVTVNGRELTIDFVLENIGNQPLSGLSLVDDLDAVLGAGNYSVTSGPTLVTAPAGLTLSTTYDGSADTDLLAGGTMAAGLSEQIRIVVDVNNVDDQGSGVGVYSNQATAAADGGVSDLSDDGSDPDPNGNARAGDSGEDDPSDFTVTPEPALGVALEAAVTVDEITLDFYLENLGNVELSNVVLQDDLDATFGAGNYSVISAPSFIVDPGSLTLNAAFDGSGDQSISTSGSLAVGASAQIRVVVEIAIPADLGSGTGVYSIQAAVSADVSGAAGSASDVSDSGSDPDPDGDGEPNEAGENDPTPAAVNLTAPSAPQNLSATAGTGEVEIDFDAPASDGGRPITNYEFSIDGGTSFTAFSPAISSGPQTLTGLSNGTTYDIQLRAVNSVGSGTATASVQATPFTVPDAPTGLVATGADQAASISFTAGADNGAAITNYEVSIDFGTFTAFSPAVTSSPVTISGLNNAQSYDLRLRAVNAAGAGAESDSVQVVPFTVPDAPNLFGMTAGDGTLSFSIQSGANNGSVISNFEFSIDSGMSFTAFSPPIPQTGAVDNASISGLDNGTTYDVQVRAVNGAGSGAASNTLQGTPVAAPAAPTGLMATPGDSSASIAFTPGDDNGEAIFSYEYSLDGGTTWFGGQTDTSPVNISGLSNGTTYDIVLRARNAIGTSPASASVQVTPQAVPGAPSGLSHVAGDGQVTVSFTEPSDEGSPITNYEYSLDEGATWIAFSPAATASPVTITGLTNGDSIPMLLRAVNALGNGPASGFHFIKAFTVPGAPTITFVSPGNTQITLDFGLVDNGGDPITNYEFSLDGGTSFAAMNPVDNLPPLIITGLSNGTTYDIQVRAVNAAGSGAASATVQGTPRNVPDAPTNLTAVPGDQSATISFTAPADNGSPISYYQYSLDGGTSYNSNGETGSPITLGGLTNGVTYEVILAAVNDAGAGAPSAAVQVTPRTVPDAPTALVATPGNQSATITFTPGADNGDAISNYEFSTDGGVSFTAFSPAATGSPVMITGLTNGTTYDVQLRAVNAAGSGAASATVQVTPRAVPEAPTGLTATPGDQSATISFTAGADNGDAISNYEFSIDGGTSFTALSPAQANSPVTISGLSNGTNYDVQLRAVNAAGSGAASSSVSVTPRAVPAAPTGLVATPGNQSATISFTAAADNGDAISNYEFSTDGGVSFTAFSPAATGSPVTISGLTNGTTYDVQLRAVNAAGSGAASTTVQVTPRAVPEAPTGLTATPGDQSATISFTAGADNGDAISNYEFSTDGGTSFTAFSPAQASSPVTISGLSNGTNYDVQLRAVNAAGSGAASSSVSVTPRAVPAAPTGLVATPGNQAASISFTAAADNGDAISNYEFSLDGGASFTAFSPAVTGSPVTLSGLTNGTPYDVQLRAVNAAGSGAASATVQVTPRTVPAAPTALVATPGNQSATVAFAAGADNGAPISNYEFSLDGGTSFTAFSPAQASSPVTISGLSNGTNYDVQLRAVNAAGSGAASATVQVTPQALPAAPTNLVATPGDRSAVISFTAGAANGSPITNYQFSLDGGTSFTAFSPAVTGSPVTISGLTNGTTYDVQLRAVNAAGSGAASATVQVTARTLPAAPTALVATPGNQSASIAFTAGADNGAAISNYEYSLDGGQQWNALTPADATPPVTITGLTNGTEFSIQLRAVNAAGAGAASTAVTVTPFTLPGAPTNIQVVFGAGSATISWDPPLDDGGSPITRYVVIASPGNASCETSGTPPATSCIIHGLQPNVPYTFSVTAFNAAGGQGLPGTTPAGTSFPPRANAPQVIPAGSWWSTSLLALLLLTLGWRYVRLAGR